MPSTITRTGRQRTALAAGPALAVEVLEDPVTVTALLGDLIDQRASTAGPPARWVVPPVNVGLRTYRTTLLPSIERSGHTVVVDAPSTRDSDVRTRLELELEVTPSDDERSTLHTSWRVELRVPLGRAALLLATPAIDAVVDRTVRQIAERSRAAIEAAAR